jgi:hypothetical protein
MNRSKEIRDSLRVLKDQRLTEAGSHGGLGDYPPDGETPSQSTPDDSEQQGGDALGGFLGQGGNQGAILFHFGGKTISRGSWPTVGGKEYERGDEALLHASMDPDNPVSDEDLQLLYDLMSGKHIEVTLLNGKVSARILDGHVD